MQIDYAESSLIARVITDFNTIDEVRVLSQDAPFSNYNYNIILQSLKQSLQEHTGESRRVIKHRLFQLYKAKTGNGLPEIYKEIISHERGAELKDLERMFMEYYTKRQLQVIGGVLVNALTDEKVAEDIVSYASTTLAQLDDFNVSEATKTNKDLITALIDKAERINSGDDPRQAIGILGVDRIIGGLQKKQTCVIGARPGIGKTAFALTIMHNYVFDNSLKVAFVSLEMEEEDLIERLVQIKSGINFYNRDTDAKNAEFWQCAASMTANDNIIFRKTTNNCITNVRSICRKLKKDNPDLDTIIVDYVQLIGSPDHREAKDVIGDVSIKLTAMASDFDVRMIILAQLTRAKDEVQLPTLKSFKGASQIEQDASIAILLHRDSPSSEDALVIVDKSRAGKAGFVGVKFNGAITKFYDESTQHDDNTF